MTAQLTPAELWQKLVDETGDALIEEAASVSLAQAEQELAAAAIDVADVYGQAESFLASLRADASLEGEGAGHAMVVDKDAAARTPRPAPRKARSIPVWVAAAAATVTAGAAVAYVATRPTEGPPPSPTTPPSTAAPPPTADLVAQARDLRRRAAVACNAGRAEACLALLDDAREKDPAGDGREEVRALRQQAEDALRKLKPK